MKAESNLLKPKHLKVIEEDKHSVCTSSEETERLLKLFQLFITINKRMQKEIYETTNKRNSDNPSKAE